MRSFHRHTMFGVASLVFLVWLVSMYDVYRIQLFVVRHENASQQLEQLVVQHTRVTDDFHRRCFVSDKATLADLKKTIAAVGVVYETGKSLRGQTVRLSSTENVQLIVIDALTDEWRQCLQQLYVLQLVLYRGQQFCIQLQGVMV